MYNSDTVGILKGFMLRSLPGTVPDSNFSLRLFLNINQFDALNFIISLFQASTCFEHMCLLSGGQNLVHKVG